MFPKSPLHLPSLQRLIWFFLLFYDLRRRVNLIRKASFDCAKDPLVHGVSLLEASAGTGKTYALARIVLRLIAEHGLEISRILVVTFTTAATEELKGASASFWYLH